MQSLVILITADELADVLVLRAVAAGSDLLIDEGLEGLREGDVHEATLGGAAVFGRVLRDSWRPTLWTVNYQRSAMRFLGPSIRAT